MTPLSPNARSVLEALYERVDAAIAEGKPRCEASGRCCRFKEWGHTLFLSGYEAAYLLESAPSYAAPTDRAGCPFQVGGLCTARKERPLGCRIYFCDPAWDAPAARLTEDGLAELKRLADEEGGGWQYAPLHQFLDAAPPRPDARVPLPVVG